MKKADIATKVFEAMDAVPLSDVGGGALKIPISDLATQEWRYTRWASSCSTSSRMWRFS
jgi:hypothetical protein